MNDKFEENLRSWLLRRTLTSALRRVGEHPVLMTTDIGLVREENQDRVATLKISSGGKSYLITVVSDGMGGMADGATCAAITVSNFFISCIENLHLPLQMMATKAANDCDRAVHSRFRGSGGATLSALIADSVGNLIAVNVGDSRIYGYASKKLTQMSTDDTVSGQFRHIYQIGNIRSNELLQFIGMGADIQPHVIEVPKIYEFLFLSTDGIHYLDQSVMERIFSTASDQATSIKRLVDVAKWCGGHDNASGAIIDIQKAVTTSVDDGVVQVWDPFGELTYFLNTSNLLPPSEGTKVNIGLKAELPKEGIKKPAKKERSKKTKNTKRKNSKKTDANEKRPQLRIDFIPDGNKE